jgi:hypothetical protein
MGGAFYLWLVPKILSFDNKNKKLCFHFVLCSLNCIFAI